MEISNLMWKLKTITEQPQRCWTRQMPEEIKIIDAVNILKWKTKETLPVFMLTFDRTENINKIYEITDIRRMRVEITPYRKSKLLLRGKNCQSWGHPLLLPLRARQLKLRQHLSLEAYCATLNCHSAQIQYPCVSSKETEFPEWGCAYIFCFNKRLPKDVALTSQRLAAAGDVLHCFSLHLAESARWISTKQAHNSQMSSYRNMSSEDCNCHF